MGSSNFYQMPINAAAHTVSLHQCPKITAAAHLPDVTHMLTLMQSVSNFSFRYMMIIYTAWHMVQGVYFSGDRTECESNCGPN